MSKVTENRGHIVIAVLALVSGLLMAHSLYVPGTIGYVDDWNIPSTPQGLWAWGISDFSPWRPIEYGLPMAYPTDFYIKLALGLAGLVGIPSHAVIAVFLTLCFSVSFIGMARLASVLWEACLPRQIVSALFYACSPVLFDALVPGYITFIVAYAALPLVALFLVRALEGNRAAWLAYSFFLAVTLAQIQFGIFDVVISVTLLVGMRAQPPAWLRAVLFSFIGMVLTYAFLFVNLLGVRGLATTATRWSEHSWTSLSAPGLLKAAMLVPSAYAYFDQSLGLWNGMWRGLALLSVLCALYAGFTSNRRAARALAVLLVVSLLFLHGANPPFTGPMTWFMSLGPLAIFRNINYVFAVVAFIVGVLLPVARLRGNYDAYLKGALLAFAVVWVLPFFANTYKSELAPIPGRNTTSSIVGEDDRTLVLPHLQVIDRRHKTTGGVNPNSVETITPIFVRNTPTGILQAAILDRLTDWTPDAASFVGALGAARVNAVALQTELDSTFPKFVYADHDEWLNDAYRTSHIQTHLAAVSGLNGSRFGTTSFYRGNRNFPDVQTADAAVAVNGSVEGEIALRAIGMNGLYLPAEAIDRSVFAHIRGLVQSLGAPDFVASPEDLKSGAYVVAGNYANVRTTNFHLDWVDPMAASDWWLNVRLLAEPHAAITDKDGAVIEIPMPQGRRHLWLQYYASAFGGHIAVFSRTQKITISTHAQSLGNYRWVDLGEMQNYRGGEFRVTSLDGFNAIGHIAMFTAEQYRDDTRRFAQLTRFGQVQVLPNITFDTTVPLTVSSGGWRPTVLLASPSSGVRYSIQAKLRRNGTECEVLIGRATLQDFLVTLDANEPQTNRGDFFSIRRFECMPKGIVALEGVRLTSRPQVFRESTENLKLDISGATGNLHVPFLPLAFLSLKPGQHTFKIGYPPLFPQLTDAWTETGAVRQLKNGATQIRLSAHNAPVDTGIKLRAPRPGERIILTGTYTVSNGALARVMFYKGKPEAVYDMPGDGQPRQFHWNLTTISRSAGDSLYVGLDPKGTVGASVTMMLNSTIPSVSANLLLMDPRFNVAPEAQIVPENLRLLRYNIDRPRAVVQYDQTYDNGWIMPGASKHIESTSGFNVWLFGKRASSGLIFYRTAVPYFAAAVLSLVLFVALGVIAAVANVRYPGASSK